MDPGIGLWLFAISLVAGALGGMLGMAGGIFIVPSRSRSRGPGVRRRFTRWRTHSHGRIQREDSPAFRRGARSAGGAWGRRRAGGHDPGRGDAGHFRCGKTGPITNVAKAMRQQLPPANNHLYEVIHEWRL